MAVADVSNELQGDGGWEFEFVDHVDKDYECMICLLPMRQPYLTKCGHCMCKTCLDRNLATNAICPQDRKPVSANDIFPDERLNRKIMALRVKCPYSSLSCAWAGELIQLLEEHIAKCKDELATCPREGCVERPTRGMFTIHFEKLCQWRHIKCDYCCNGIPLCKIEIVTSVDPLKCYQNLTTLLRAQAVKQFAHRFLNISCSGRQEHLDMDCQEFVVVCPSNCEDLLPRKKLLSHMNNDCPKRVVECPFSNVGCDSQVQFNMLDKHISGKVTDHMILMNRKVKEQGDIIQKLEQENSELLILIGNADSYVLDDIQVLSWKRNYLLKYVQFLRDEQYFDRLSFGSANSPYWMYNDDKRIHLILMIRRIDLVTGELKQSPVFCNGTGNGYNLRVWIKSDMFGIELRPGNDDSLLPWPFMQCIVISVVSVQDRVNDVVLLKKDDGFNKPEARKDLDVFLMPDRVTGSEILKRSYKLIELLTDNHLLVDKLIFKVSVEKHCSLES